MTKLGLQDVFEPYYEGRKNSFATIEPSAVERARRIKEQIDEARRARRDNKRPDEAA